MKTRIQHVNSPSTSEENFLSQTSDQNTPHQGSSTIQYRNIKSESSSSIPCGTKRSSQILLDRCHCSCLFQACLYNKSYLPIFSSPFYYIELLAFQCNKSQSPALLWNFITPFNVFPHHVIFLPLDQCIFQSVASHSMYTSRIFFPLSRKFSSINDRGSHWDYSPVISDHPSRSTTNNCLYQRLLNFN